MLNKFKSKWVWVSIISIVIFVLRKYGVLETDITAIETVLDMVLALLVSLGVLNNPDKEKF